MASLDSLYFGDNKPQQDHSGRSLRGGAVSLVGRAVNAGTQIVSVLLLARMLSPEDYGLVAMVSALTGFAPVLVDLGTRDAITQRDRISPGEVSALFWITVAVGCGFSLLIAGCGPLIARFYGEPRLTAIVLVSSLPFVANALLVQHSALMRRALMFQDLAVLEIAANILSAAGSIAMALLGFGYWALLARPVTTPLFFAAGVWLRSGWLPGWPTITANVKEMLRFGLNITGFCLADFGGRSGDRVAIGYKIGATGLGQYQSALFVHENLVDVLVFPLHGVAVAGLSKLRNNVAELRKSWAKALCTLAFFAMPAFGLLAVTSRDLIPLLLGAKWSSAGVLLSVLAFRGLPQSLDRTVGWLHVSAGRTDRWMRWGLLTAGAQLVAVFCGLPFGPMGVAVASVVMAFLLVLPGLAYAGRPLDIGALDAMKVVWRPLVASLLAASLALLLRGSLESVHSFVRTTVVGLAYVLSYLVVVVGIFNEWTPVRTTHALIRGYVPGRFRTLSQPGVSGLVNSPDS